MASKKRIRAGWREGRMIDSRKGRDAVRDQRHQLCGTGHAFDLWMRDHPEYKAKPLAGHAAYRQWLSIQPPCGHKDHPRGTAAQARDYNRKPPDHEPAQQNSAVAAALARAYHTGDQTGA